MAGWVLVYAAFAAGLVGAWLVVRRDRYAEVTGEPEFAGSALERDIHADDRGTRLAGVRAFAEFADRVPSLRQDFVDQLFVQLDSGWPENRAWQAELWPVLLPRLRRGSPCFWPGMDLHPKSMVLHDVELRGCEIRNAIFHDMHFSGDVHFDGAVCTGLVSFKGSRFTRHAYFGGARFETGADFGHTTFTGTAAFAGASTEGETWFDEARFSARADFGGARFADTSFAGAGFAGRTSFRDARFAEAFFGEARFSGHADFTGATAERVRFPRARARTDVHAVRHWPPGWQLGPSRPRKPGHWADLTRA
ncbi:pentapeptide repeat-containing protein [Amycolatopsis sp. cmx-4-68]|uniref:pentapeptide repeat-containing protein n=1 Tax=Amycolatopsis sp. cmx-4-68 TaxID=2790938 RepID=UPI00397A510A